VADLQEGWREHPPLQWMVQGYLGISGKPKDEGEFDDLVAAMAGQG
jgi:hypothetical protein